ncbi:MAG: hypothetical protein HY902_15310 [Deltaproteobacteria bacterium]|nr:hypothetical protein [Deltaproteobacteria bacterium]
MAHVTMKPADEPEVARLVIGKRLVHVEHLDHQWNFILDAGTVLSADSEWRLLDQGRVRVTAQDDGQWFGLASPVCAATVVQNTLAGRVIRSASVAMGDLTLDFGDGLALQALQLSSGYEAWHLFDKGTAIHCLGGGDLAIEVIAPAS